MFLAVFRGAVQGFQLTELYITSLRPNLGCFIHFPSPQLCLHGDMFRIMLDFGITPLVPAPNTLGIWIF